jgi:alpha-galactosidase
MEIWVRPLADGSKAIGMFNRHPQPMEMRVDFRQLGLAARAKVRDVWGAKDIGSLQEYQTVIPGHGVVLLRVTAQK